MGRTHILSKPSKAHISHLHTRKTDSEKRKKELITYLEKLKQKYNQGEITYARYVEIIHEKRNGRTIEEWIHYYHLESLECHRKIYTHKKSQNRKRFFAIIIGSIIILTLVSLLFNSFTQTGLVTEGNVSEVIQKKFSEKLNTKFSDSEIFEWTPENSGAINSVSLSGIIQGSEEILVYIEDILILNSSNIKETRSWTITAIMSLALIRISSKRKKKDKKEKIILDDLSIPITIFTNQLGGLEGLVKYLKENLELKYSEIANIINRDDRTIWTAYNKAVKKQSTKIQISKTLVFIPISILRNRKLTIFEAIVVYLKDKGMTYAEIGRLLNRDQRNIWTMYSRAIKKA